MTSSTATLVTSGSKSDVNTARLRGVPENGSTKATPATPVVDDNNYDHFFWTYTEEPHRTRRLAIIKAHPEV
jgi:sphingolipid delta-4 desaturase